MGTASFCIARISTLIISKNDIVDCGDVTGIDSSVVVHITRCNIGLITVEDVVVQSCHIGGIYRAVAVHVTHNTLLYLARQWNIGVTLKCYNFLEISAERLNNLCTLGPFGKRASSIHGIDVLERLPYECACHQINLATCVGNWLSL